MSLLDLGAARNQMVVAEADARKALAEIGQIGRLLLNAELKAPSSAAGVHAMGERLQVLRHALHDLENVHRGLRDEVEPKRSRAAVAIERNTPGSVPRPDDASPGRRPGGRCPPDVGPRLITSRCSELGPFETRALPKRILFVENHRVFAQTAIDQFMSSADVHVVHTVEAGLKAVASRSFDVALVAFDLDDGSGDRFVSVVRAAHPQLPIIAVSADDDGNAALLRAGAHGVCKKADFRKIGGILANVVHESFATSIHSPFCREP